MDGTTGPPAIETSYAGCRFRSRLEARWAVFFDALGIKWEYEKEGYVVNGRAYLPDFYLPRETSWVEVKGSEELLDKQLMRDFAETAGRIIVLGPIPRPAKENAGWVLLSPGDGTTWCEDATFTREGITNESAQDYALEPQNWLTPSFRARYSSSPAASRAYAAARSARFEHGQSGPYRGAR